MVRRIAKTTKVLQKRWRIKSCMSVGQGSRARTKEFAKRLDLPCADLKGTNFHCRKKSNKTERKTLSLPVLNDKRFFEKKSGNGKKRASYYPFGMAMPGRNIVGDYRYAFQGQEKDPETGKEAFELRLWDGRIGRWLAPDPYGQFASPYLGMGNNPILLNDPDGGFTGPPRTRLGRFFRNIGNRIADFWHRNFSRMRPLRTDKQNGRRWKAWMQKQGGPRYVQNRRDWLGKIETFGAGLVLNGLSFSNDLLLTPQTPRITTPISFQSGLTFPGASFNPRTGRMRLSNTILDPTRDIPAIGNYLNANPGATVRIDFPNAPSEGTLLDSGIRVTRQIRNYITSEHRRRHQLLARRLRAFGVNPSRVQRGNRAVRTLGFFGNPANNIITVIPSNN